MSPTRIIVFSEISLSFSCGLIQLHAAAAPAPLDGLGSGAFLPARGREKSFYVSTELSLEPAILGTPSH